VLHLNDARVVVAPLALDELYPLCGHKIEGRKWRTQGCIGLYRGADSRGGNEESYQSRGMNRKKGAVIPRNMAVRQGLKKRDKSSRQ
jgi:hypothetical protein